MVNRIVVIAVEIGGCVACAGFTWLACRRMMARQAAADKERIQTLAGLLAQEQVSCDVWQVQAEDLQAANSLLATAGGERDFYRTKFVELDARWQKAFVRERGAHGLFVPREKPEQPVVAGS